MAKALFICEKDVLNSSVVTQVRERFEPLIMQFDYRKISDCISRKQMELVVIYMRDITPPSEAVLKELLENEKKVPFMLIGNETDCTVLTNTSEAKIIKCVHTPFSLSSFFEEYKATCDMIDAENSTENNTKKIKYVENKKHILVVDDDAVYLRTMMNWLKKDYEVSVVKSGMDAVAYLREETPDLILLDYEMPMWTGIKTLKEIRADKRGANVPVIFLTGVSSTQVVKEAISLNPQGYVLKNISQKGLLEKIKAII